MNNNNNIEKLASCLKQEITWIEQLNNLLAEEKVVLANRQFTQLEDLAGKKQDLSTKLEDSAKERMTIIVGKPNQTPKMSMQEFLKTCSQSEASHINKLNGKLAELLAKCRELNTVNGQVIANNMYTGQKIVDILSNKPQGANVYTPSGDIKPSSPGDGYHQKA